MVLMLIAFLKGRTQSPKIELLCWFRTIFFSLASNSDFVSFLLLILCVLTLAFDHGPRNLLFPHEKP